MLTLNFLKRLNISVFFADIEYLMKIFKSIYDK